MCEPSTDLNAENKNSLNAENKIQVEYEENLMAKITITLTTIKIDKM